MCDLKCKRADCDEIWSFVGTKEKNVPEALKDTFGFVNLYTYQWNSRHNRPARGRSQPPMVLRALLHVSGSTHPLPVNAAKSPRVVRV